MTNDDEVRYVLTRKGMEYLAARAGVRPVAFGQRGGVSWFDPETGQTPGEAIRHAQHATGVNRFMARLAADARTHGGRLAQWLNEAESGHRFVASSGRWSWVRPDASGVVELSAGRFWFLLEYERGTLDGGDLRAKLAAYQRYYEQQVWQARFPDAPLLLFVCADDSTERRVLRAARTTSVPSTVLVTVEWRHRRWGVLGSVWRGVSQEERRPFAEAIS